MKVELRDSFLSKLEAQTDYIATDKPKAARKFKADVLRLINSLSKHPFIHRRSIYFNDDSIRDATFKGYTIVYLIDEERELISVFGLIKYEDGF